MSDQLIDNYVHELRVAAWVRQVPKARTAQIEDETRARIQTELAAAGKTDDATVYDVLARLGPADDIVARQGGAPGATVAVKDLSLLDKVRLSMAIHGWGVAEIVGLLLLIVGPFLIWWIGPIFGIILIRWAADRWTPAAMRRATAIVFGLCAVQAVLAVVILVYVLMTGGVLADQLQNVMTIGTGRIGPGLMPIPGTAESGPLLGLRVFGSLLAPAAGLISGFYLLLSPRVRS